MALRSRQRQTVSERRRGPETNPSAAGWPERFSRSAVRRLGRVADYLVIVLAAVLAYSSALGNQYAFDAVAMVQQNVRIRRLDRPREIFATSYWDDPGKGSEYRPLTMLSYALDYAVAEKLLGRGRGLEPWVYHLTNMALHAAVSCLAAWAVAVLFRRRLLGAATGLLFALHPIHTETVSGVVGRAELLAAAGFFLALVAWSRAREAGSFRHSALWALALGLAYALAVFSKENVLTLLGVVLLEALIWRRMAKMTGRNVEFWARLLSRQGLCLLAIVVVTAGYLAARYEILGGLTRSERTLTTFLDNPIFYAPTVQRLATAIRIQGEYIWQLVWPANLIADYSYNAAPIAHSFLETGVLVGVLTLLALAAAFAVGYRDSPVTAFGIGFYALTMSLASNIFFPIGTIKAERLLYLPSFGFCLVMGLVFERLWERFRVAEARLTIAGILAALCAVYGARTFQRNPDWKNDYTLFGTVVKAVPENSKAHHNLGNALAQRGEIQEALHHFTEALRIQPLNPYPLANRAVLAARDALDLERVGQLEEAKAKWEQSDEDFRKALNSSPDFVPALNYYGTTLCIQGRFDEGLKMLERSYELNPRNGDTILLLGKWHWWAAGRSDSREEHLKESVRWLREALDIWPHSYVASKTLGFALYELGDYGASLEVLRQTAAQWPDSPLADVNCMIGGALYHLNRLDEAEQTFREILRGSPNEEKALEGLRRTREAKQTGRRADFDATPPVSAIESPEGP